jgi:hypothetical protein
MLAQLIAQHAAAEAAAGNWSAVATAVKALGLRATSRKCGSVETAAALAAVGVNWAAVMDVIDDDATGRFILTMLAAEGVQWGHALTIPYLRSKQGAVLTVAGVDALIELSSPLLYATVTAADCQSAMSLDAKDAVLELVVTTACEAAREEYRRAESTPASIVAAAVAVLEG